MTFPENPVAAVTHRDPYPYYAELVARRPVYRDEALGFWVVSSAAAVNEVLTSDVCCVRPASEPVPRVLLGTPAGEIFRHLVRMNDGPVHGMLKPAISRSLKAMDAGRIGEESRAWAGSLAGELPQMDFIFNLSTYVIGSMLGVPRTGLAQAARWTGEFVMCLSPLSSADQMERGKLAAGELLALFRSMVSGGANETLFGVMAGEMKRSGRAGTDRIAANGVGMLSQAYEATAGLIGNTLVTLAAHRDVREQAARDPRLMAPVVQEVVRFDPPVQNTRRYLARAGTVAGHEMKEGDALLVVLAAANRDPAVNPNPERFDTHRANRRSFTFGAGVHACPGETFATIIAGAGVAQLLRSGIDVKEMAEGVAYRASVNARIPLFVSP